MNKVRRIPLSIQVIVALFYLVSTSIVFEKNSMFFVSLYHLYVFLDLGGIRRMSSSTDNTSGAGQEVFSTSYHMILQRKGQGKVTVLQSSVVLAAGQVAFKKMYFLKISW
jgi:hypothetical protein